MNTVQRIAKNTGVLIISRIVEQLLAFFYGIYIARYLGAEGFGILSFAFAFTTIFSSFTELGLASLTVREVARDKSLTSKYLGNIAVIKLILVMVTFGLIVLTINLLGYPEQTIKVVYLVALSTVFGAFSRMFYSIFQAYEKMEYQSIGQILNSVLMLGGVLFAISQGFNVVGFASIYLLASAVALMYSFTICVWKFVLPKIEVDWSFWKPTIKEALPFGLTAIFVTNFQWISSVMLSLMKGDAVVGWYNAAYRIALVPLFMPATFMAAIYPIMSIFFKNSPNSLKLSLEKSFKYLTILGIPIGIGIMLLAKRLILVIFGAEYTNSIIALQILAWSSVFIFLDNAFANLLNSINKQVIITKIMGICLGVNVVLNLILIPKYSLIGASITTALTQLIALLLIFIWSSRIGYSVFRKVFANIIAKVVISSALMGIFVVYFQNLSLWVLVPSAALLYFVVLYIIQGIDKEDINLVNMFVRKK